MMYSRISSFKFQRLSIIAVTKRGGREGFLRRSERNQELFGHIGLLSHWVDSCGLDSKR